MDTDEVLKGLARESVKQGENLRSAVRELTLNALKSRELTIGYLERNRLPQPAAACCH